MYANYNQFDRDGRKKNLREGLPAYAYSRGVQLHSDTNSYLNMQSDMYNSGRNTFNFILPLDDSEFELPNEQQISQYEQLMMMSNETIVLSNFLDKEDTPQLSPTIIHQKPDSFAQGKFFKNMPPLKKQMEILPFYKICFDVMKVTPKKLNWKLCLITEHSTEIRSEIQQIYLHMWLYYKNYMQKVDLGALDTCNRIISFTQSVTETERFFLTIRDDYLMTTQIFVLFKSILTNQHPSVFQQTLETLELWKNLINNINIKPKTYEFSANSISSEMIELLELLIRSYFKTRHYLEACFVLMINQEDTIKEQQIKDDMLCKYWYLMVDTPHY